VNGRDDVGARRQILRSRDATRQYCDGTGEHEPMTATRIVDSVALFFDHQANPVEALFLSYRFPALLDTGKFRSVSSKCSINVRFQAGAVSRAACSVFSFEFWARSTRIASPL
jgi:hypothetical protein